MSFSLEIGLAPDDESGKPFTENSLFTGVTEGVGNVFDNEIQKMARSLERIGLIE